MNYSHLTALQNRHLPELCTTELCAIHVLFHWISSNLFPFQGSLSRWNRKKYGEFNQGVCGGCSICTSPYFARNNIRCVCWQALSYKLNIHHTHWISVIQFSSYSLSSTLFARKEIWWYFWHPTTCDEAFEQHPKGRL